MALARVGVISGTNTTFASSVTTGSRTTSVGNMLIAGGEADTVGSNGCTVTDSKSNIWTRIRSTVVAATFDLEIWVAVSLATAGASHTVNMTDNGGGVDSLLIAEEWSGQSASPSDQNTSATGVASTALNSGATSTTVQANEAVIGLGVASGNVTMTVGSGYSNLTRINTTFSTLAFESKIVSAIGAQTATMTSGTAGSWICIVATFKELGSPLVRRLVTKQAVNRASRY